ncbi:MAG: hypothetical protein AAGD06_32270 [Acidobacteriota bacterium]
MPEPRNDRNDLILALRWPLVLFALAVLGFLAYRETLDRAGEGARAVGELAGSAADRAQQLAEGLFTGDVTERFVSSMPKVDRSGEGRLEVARAEIVERFNRRDERRMFFDVLPLGITEVEIEVPVTYRYHVVLEAEWQIEVRGPVCLVFAPEIRPSLPPSIHTDRMRSRAQQDLLRFDGAEQLESLRRSLTPRLSERAASPGHTDLVREEARRAVETFVRTWLLDQEFWVDDRFSTVRVIFPDELDTAVGAESAGPVEAPEG